MGFLDDFFDTKIVDSKDTRINYTPMKLPDVKLDVKGTIKKTKECIDVCSKWAYENTVDWCALLKGTHIHKLCMEEIFDTLERSEGVRCCDFIETLRPDFCDYWYNEDNLKHYTKAQLKRVEKELEKGNDSMDLVIDMLQYTWTDMIPKKLWYEELDDLIIYKLRVRWLK